MKILSVDVDVVVAAVSGVGFRDRVPNYIHI